MDKRAITSLGRSLYTPVPAVMDHLKIHKMEGIEELIVATGARVEYLPPYLPDFNPIEANLL